MENLFFDVMNQFGYVAVGALVLLECVFPPIPSEIVLPMAGFLVQGTSMTLPGVIVAATLGATAGATLFYGVGRILSEERLTALFETRPMRVLGFRGADVTRVVDWFNTKGQISILICRCVPGIRSLISLPAGTAKMALPKFFAYTFIGSLIWNTVLCSLGYSAGAAWQTTSEQIGVATDTVLYVLIGVCAVLACWWIAKRVVPNLRRNASSNS